MKPPRFLLINHKGCRHCQDAEMVMDPNGPLIGYAWFEQLEAENARLKAEVERLTNENGNNSMMKEEWYLKCMFARAEVERLRTSSFVTAVPVEQYERVIEAGDALAREICILGPVDDKEMKAIEAWNAAKEGKQP